jgi:hypothetical protein
MESFGGAVYLMLFVYAMAAVISLATAWIIKLIFFAIQLQKKRNAAPRQVRPSAPPADVPAKRTA